MTLSPMSLLAVLALILSVAALGSAVHLAVALFAKSLKEAQSYLTPLAIALVVPAMLGVLPGLELTNRLALVPILNVMLASRKVMAGDYLWGPMALIFLSSCLYAAAALTVAAAIFRRESVLFRT